MAFGIAPRARVAVPIPGTAHAIARFQHMGGKPLAVAQGMKLIHTGETSADDQRVIELRLGRGGGQGAYGIKHGSFFILAGWANNLTRTGPLRQAGANPCHFRDIAHIEVRRRP